MGDLVDVHCDACGYRQRLAVGVGMVASNEIVTCRNCHVISVVTTAEAAVSNLFDDPQTFETGCRECGGSFAPGAGPRCPACGESRVRLEWCGLWD